MRIEFSEEGGIAHFPGLARPVTVDTDHLAKEEGEYLRQYVDASRFFDLPATVGVPPKGAADYRQYTLTVDDGRKKHTVRIPEPVEDPNLRELIQAVRKQVKAARGQRS